MLVGRRHPVDSGPQVRCPRPRSAVHALAAAALGVAAILGLLPLPPAAPRGVTACGVERWPVKILADPAAKDVDLHPVSSTVATLRQMPVPPVDRTTPRLPVERKTYTVRARLLRAKLEPDADYHLVLADPGDPQQTMIAEIPAPECAYGSRVRGEIARARREYDRRFGRPSRTRYAGVRGRPVIDVTGVLFVDVLHHQNGVAPNGVELHPVLDIR